ncbi:MAG TPA: DNA-binding response regulator, partial [Cytophagales bacterium]|nr:DNA-binding response regulator [Cytophagales bacterium]
LEVLPSVLETANYLANHQPDLIFLDIQLADGICFELFEGQAVDTPIIFTTAYDEYMQRAFKVNSVDYLLKPIREEDLRASLAKYRRYQQPQALPMRQLFEGWLADQPAYKCRFMVKAGRGFVSVEVGEVAYFLAENKLVYLITGEGKRYAVDYTLDQLEGMLSPKEFIKVSRNYLLSSTCVQRVDAYFNHRLLVTVSPPTKEEVIVTRSYVKAFKAWMEW